MTTHRKCSICGKPIILVPSATERAKRSGLPASYYLNLFTAHSDCLIEKRNQETSYLIRRKNLQKLNRDNFLLFPKQAFSENLSFRPSEKACFTAGSLFLLSRMLPLTIIRPLCAATALFLTPRGAIPLRGCPPLFLQA